jgi:hypothetical protein
MRRQRRSPFFPRRGRPPTSLISTTPPAHSLQSSPLEDS